MFQALKDLSSDIAQLLNFHTLILLIFQPGVKITIEHVRDYAEMAPKEEAILNLDQFVLFGLFCCNFHQYLGFDLSIFTLTFLILTDFYCDFTLVIFHISALDNLAKSSLSAYFVYEVSVVNLLSNLDLIAAVGLRRI